MVYNIRNRRRRNHAKAQYESMIESHRISARGMAAFAMAYNIGNVYLLLQGCIAS